MINCEFESGSKTSLRHVTVDGIILKGDKVLLNKRGSYAGKPILESGKWGLIGGFVDRDETVIEALIREVREETGCEITSPRLLHIKDSPKRPKEDRQNISFVFVADFLSQKEIKTEEVRKLQWFSLSDLPGPDEIAFDHYQDLQRLIELNDATEENPAQISIFYRKNS